jgi:Beta/Gamma crystallin
MRKVGPLGQTLPALLVLGAAIAGSRPAAAQGVTLFRDRDQRGPSQTFHDDVPDLRYTQLGSRRASSIQVPPGCVAVLFQRPGYRGRSATFRDSDNDLSNTDVGEDTASSLRVNCRRGGSDSHYRPDWHADRPEPSAPARGVVLYRDRDASGPSQFFDKDVPDLDRTQFGSRMASSIDVSPGCIAVLYEAPGFRGRKTEFKERDNNLRNTTVGEDSVSSLQVRCR